MHGTTQQKHTRNRTNYFKENLVYHTFVLPLQVYQLHLSRKFKAAQNEKVLSTKALLLQQWQLEKANTLSGRFSASKASLHNVAKQRCQIHISAYGTTGAQHYCQPRCQIARDGNTNEHLVLACAGAKLVKTVCKRKEKNTNASPPNL